MPKYVMTFKSLADPSRAEVAALRKIPGLSIVEYRHGIASVEADEADIGRIRKAAANWTLSPMGVLRPC
jgi:hypothetical protein